MTRSRSVLRTSILVASCLFFATAARANPPVGTISTFGPALAGTACANPEGLAIDLQGNIYTASDIDGATTGTICVFSPAGALTRTISIRLGRRASRRWSGCCSRSRTRCSSSPPPPPRHGRWQCARTAVS